MCIRDSLRRDQSGGDIFIDAGDSRTNRQTGCRFEMTDQADCARHRLAPILGPVFDDLYLRRMEKVPRFMLVAGPSCEAIEERPPERFVLPAVIADSGSGHGGGLLVG